MFSLVPPRQSSSTLFGVPTEPTLCAPPSDASSNVASTSLEKEWKPSNSDDRPPETSSRRTFPTAPYFALIPHVHLKLGCAGASEPPITAVFAKLQTHQRGLAAYRFGPPLPLDATTQPQENRLADGVSLRSSSFNVVDEPTMEQYVDAFADAFTRWVWLMTTNGATTDIDGYDALLSSSRYLPRADVVSTKDHTLHWHCVHHARHRDVAALFFAEDGRLKVLVASNSAAFQRHFTKQLHSLVELQWIHGAALIEQPVGGALTPVWAVFDALLNLELCAAAAPSTDSPMGRSGGSAVPHARLTLMSSFAFVGGAWHPPAVRQMSVPTSGPPTAELLLSGPLTWRAMRLLLVLLTEHVASLNEFTLSAMMRSPFLSSTPLDVSRSAPGKFGSHTREKAGALMQMAVSRALTLASAASVPSSSFSHHLGATRLCSAAWVTSDDLRRNDVLFQGNEQSVADREYIFIPQKIVFCRGNVATWSSVGGKRPRDIDGGGDFDIECALLWWDAESEEEEEGADSFS